MNRKLGHLQKYFQSMTSFGVGLCTVTSGAKVYSAPGQYPTKVLSPKED